MCTSDKQREEIITETDSSAEEEKQTADEGQNEAAENTAEEEKQILPGSLEFLRFNLLFPCYIS